MGWPPKTGKLLPQAGEAWCEPSKWDGWILAAHGHGPEWAKVLHVTLDDVDAVWEAIAAAVLIQPVSRIVDRGEHGLNCRVDTQLTIAERSATIRTAWHYADAGSAPRLVSAYPKL
jgi:Domain of unknown function (DUF6883)